MLKNLLLAILFTSCAGYRFQSKTNPFAQYGINSIAVPMFYNKSNFSDVSGPFTKEIFKTLVDFNDLKLSKSPSRSDAVLIGIIESPAKLKESRMVTNINRGQSVFGDGVLGGPRRDQPVPTANIMRINLRIIVLKHPTDAEIRFFQTQFSKKVLSSKVIFNENINLSREYFLKRLKGDGISVIGSQNRGLEKQQLQLMAEQAASSFKDMVLYAF